MANVKVTYQEMRDAGSRLNNGQQELDAKLDELSSLVESLVAEGFVTDTASGAFRESYSTFTTGAKQTIAGLEGMRTYLNKAADTFEQADTTLASALR